MEKVNYVRDQLYLFYKYHSGYNIETVLEKDKPEYRET